MELLKNSITWLLIFVHAGLFCWSLVGFAEWFAPAVPWKPLSNRLFPGWLLFLHWSAIFVGGSTFLFGYFSKWIFTPHAMCFAYGFMALVCAIETFGFMTSANKYWAMTTEYLTYSAILVMLFRASWLRERFVERLL